MTRANSVVAGVGAIGFAVLTCVAIFFVNWPGGGYSESMAKSYVGAWQPARRADQHVDRTDRGGGLKCLLAYLRQAAE